MDQGIFENLFTQKFPGIYRALADFNFPLSAVTYKWFMCLFSSSLFPEVATKKIFFSKFLRFRFNSGTAFF